MSFRVLSAANQTDGCKSLSYLILLSTSLVPCSNLKCHKVLEYYLALDYMVMTSVYIQTQQ